MRRSQIAADSGSGETAQRSEQWLVVIDMQRAFADPSSGWAAADYDRAESNVRRLVEYFAGRVIWTRFVRDPDERGAWASYYERWPAFRVPSDASLWDLTIAPAAGADVIDEPTFSKWRPRLQDMVGTAPLVLCGVATECCVLATAFGAADSGNAVTVASDACAGASPELHETALRILQANSPLIDVATTADIASREAAPVRAS